MRPMSSLDDKLRNILEDWYPGTMYENVIPKLKQAFADELGINNIIQDLVNLRANMQHDLIRLGLTYNDPKLMTGQEWLNRYKQSVPPLLSARADGMNKLSDAELYLEAAKKASGIDD